MIVSSTEKTADFFAQILNIASIRRISVSKSCREARELLSGNIFDLVVINAPLQDETGENLSRHIVSRGEAQVILAVKNEYFDALSAACCGDGVLTVPKPINKAFFLSSLTLAKAAHHRIKRVQTENERLKQKIEDIRIVDRAKLILISHMKMSESDAHRYIEKQSMDLRATKRIIAEGILKTYEN